MVIIYKIFIFILLIFQNLPAQFFKIPEIPTIDDFITDTLYVELPHDSIRSNFQSGLQVLDTRDINARILDIQQIDKYKVIPVDQYITLDRPLAELFTEQFSYDSVVLPGLCTSPALKSGTTTNPPLPRVGILGIVR